MDRNTLESYLFTWQGWDDNGIMSPMFYNVELLVPIGQFPVGTKFTVAALDGEKSLINLIDENEVQHTFELNLAVGRQLTAEEVQACYPPYNPEAGCTCGHDHG